MQLLHPQYIMAEVGGPSLPYAAPNATRGVSSWDTLHFMIHECPCPLALPAAVPRKVLRRHHRRAAAGDGAHRRLLPATSFADSAAPVHSAPKANPAAALPAAQFDGWGYTAHSGGFDGPMVPKSQFATVASDPNFLDGKLLKKMDINLFFTHT